MRLATFDYSRPYFYMVTLKCHHGCAPLSAIVAPGRCEMNATTRAMVNCIRNFHRGCDAIEPIERFSIMPDHIHLLIKVRDRSGTHRRGEDAVELRGGFSAENFAPSARRFEPNSPMSCAPTLRLETIVSLLMQALEGRYAETTGRREEVFGASWHDWIVRRDGQLAAFTRYIRENPSRSWMRRANRQFFTVVREVDFAGRRWKAYGNLELLALPVVEPFRCSRSWMPDDAEWRGALGRAMRIGPGGAGVGTFMSPCEKECGNAIYKAGGSLIVLTPEGFGARWHPTRNKEALCAKGRMLFLSLWEESTARPDNATLYNRCHEMGAVVAAAFGEGRRI